MTPNKHCDREAALIESAAAAAELICHALECRLRARKGYAHNKECTCRRHVGPAMKRIESKRRMGSRSACNEGRGQRGVRNDKTNLVRACTLSLSECGELPHASCKYTSKVVVLLVASRLEKSRQIGHNKRHKSCFDFSRLLPLIFVITGVCVRTRWRIAGKLLITRRDFRVSEMRKFIDVQLFTLHFTRKRGYGECVPIYLCALRYMYK